MMGWIDRHPTVFAGGLIVILATAWFVIGWSVRGSGFTCPPGQQPELIWGEQGVTVTGKCEPDPIRYIPRGE